LQDGLTVPRRFRFQLHSQAGLHPNVDVIPDCGDGNQKYGRCD